MLKKCKRWMSLLLALALCLGMLGGFVPEAAAEELSEPERISITETDSYVLSYDGAVEGYPYGNLPYMYKSPFKMHHSYNDPAAGPGSVWSYTYTNEIFQLINTARLGQGGDGPYASIPAYCTDADTNTRSTTTYRRINLEDSTYHESGVVPRLRSVILNSFPYIQDLAVITASANRYLEANGKTPVSGLQIGEVMLATQQVIWTLTHGDKYTVDDPYTSCGSYDGSDVVYTINKDDKETEHTESNIVGIFEYLMSLEGTAPIADAVSEATFENVVYTAVPTENGTFTVTVTFDVNTTVRAGDSLTLGAVCGEQVKLMDLTSGGSYSMVFEGMNQRLPVELQINGYQTGGDVYLFDALGDRTASQSMIGYDNSTLPVHAEVIATPNRIVNIFKTTSEDDGFMPLANIEFDIYKVATLREIESGAVKLSEKPSAEEISQYAKPENLIATLKTDVQGFATYNFTAHSQPDGVYMVVERFSPATTGPVEPFFLVIPGTTEDGSAHAYTITVNPKNTTETGPDIQKDVTRLDNNSDSFDVDEVHLWIIRGGVPAGIATAEKYVITDTIDYRLTYQKGSPVVKLFTRAGEELPLTNNTHYSLTEGSTQVDNRTVDRFAVSLTAEGMTYVADNLGEGESIPEIRVCFHAVINSNASMGENIPNQAHLDYTNSAGVDYDADSDIPEVHTGGTSILKTDAEGKILPGGATFKIAREATDAELENPDIIKEILTVNGEELTVVFRDFYPTEDLSGDKVYEVTTGEDGRAVIYGLAYGTYYIVETKAPAGYNLLTTPIRVTINKYSHLTEVHDVKDDDGKIIDNTILVINTKYVLPQTGGTGTAMFTLAGIAIIASACALLLLNSKKKYI